MEKKNSPTRSVERALEILDCFLVEDKLTLNEVSEKTKLSPSTVYRIMQTLQNRYFIERDDKNKKFFIGNKISKLANSITNDQNMELRDASYQYMTKLKDKYNENIRLYIPDGTYKLCIEVIESTREFRAMIKVGERHTIVRGAAGKIFLAYMEKDLRNNIIKDINITEEMLNKIRVNGYALSLGEREDGLVGISAPIFNDKGNIAASLSISGPAVRFINEEMSDKINDVVKYCKEISSKLGFLSAK
nr:IclR family transcriptional regulator [Sedimentibacter sp.]